MCQCSGQRSYFLFLNVITPVGKIEIVGVFPWGRKGTGCQLTLDGSGNQARIWLSHGMFEYVAPFFGSGVIFTTKLAGAKFKFSQLQ